MSFFKKLILNLPEVASPTQKRLSFKEKIKWTILVLVLFFILGMIPLFGLGPNALQQFEYLSIILGAKFGSIISLGIGPIVTASIVLQLLNGSGIVKFDLNSHEGKQNFQGIQKLLAIFFIIFEAAIYVFMGGLAPASQFAGTPLYFQFQLLLIFQLFLGGMLILFMDEIISKWGFGSGISLFIVAGVSEQIFIRAFSPLPSPANPSIATGAIPALFQSLAAGDPRTAGLMLAGVIATALVFAIAVYAQAMKVEIPLSFGRVRGHGVRWPLSFIYTSNIPVILVAALMANIQLWARLLQNWGHPFLGRFVGNTPVSGIVSWLYSPDLVGRIIKGSFLWSDLGHSAVYILVMMLGAMMFSIFWVQTAGMDARSQAKQMLNSGLQIPGFRRDERILERLLNRYIWPLAIMGALTVGLLAALADLSGALSSGTGILLSVMIIYKLYEEIAQQHMMDMHPMMRKFMEG
ncbi:MAG: preprotein translocase subunit SecY [Candidatus Woesearchaeota archaeon]|jgi:preprotein translocase subunit SecY|nr:preprotein translocase subunit SecY [Candidatus Woesearchaeota archaeon]MDP7505987.1 preprotein translocase subunit SecY [Candidatus Woesearchaeota archaeon]MDP7610450.1 preprotein translocase subunit SecY [Candidatus Woesearchaeota archaeon]|tara:strand:- start:8822 stop:10213 length:1392 start_codon:yes stop_codon:yes gene_type:complete